MPEAPLVITAPTAPTKTRRKAPPALVIFGIGWLMLMLIVALLADILAPYAYTALDLRNRLSPPILLGGTWLHPLGTDELGRDVLSRLIYSIRTSLLIAFGATIIGAAVGTSLAFWACMPGKDMRVLRAGLHLPPARKAMRLQCGGLVPLHGASMGGMSCPISPRHSLFP